LSGAPPGRLVLAAPNGADFTMLRQQEPYLLYYGREMMVCRSLEEAEAWLDREDRTTPPQK
jgi:hypothetical protein